MTLRDDLANVLHDSGCGCSDGLDECTYADADAILASDLIRKIRAEAWDEGHAMGAIDVLAGAESITPNPYRKEQA